MAVDVPAVDVGGSFTDVVAHFTDGRAAELKLPSTDRIGEARKRLEHLFTKGTRLAPIRVATTRRDSQASGVQ